MFVYSKKTKVATMYSVRFQPYPTPYFKPTVSESQPCELLAKEALLNYIKALALEYAKINKHEDAFYWYSKAAEQGDPEAQFELACLYEEGMGCVQDKQQAAIWYQKSAEQDYEEALVRLYQVIR